MTKQPECSATVWGGVGMGRQHAQDDVEVAERAVINAAKDWLTPGLRPDKANDHLRAVILQLLEKERILRDLPDP